MASFLALSAGSAAAFAEQLAGAQKEAEEWAGRELAASVRIQKVYRGSKGRTRVANMRFAGQQIQRVFRGIQGRAVAQSAKESKLGAEERAIFEYYASMVQRAFRGFYSRRYAHDFFARKAYIASIRQKSEELRRQLEESSVVQAAEEEERVMTEAKQSFDKATANLHHLVSTQSCRGIYNSPYAEELGTVPTAFGERVETHLNRSAKNQSRQRVTIQQRNPGRIRPERRTRASINASSPYGADREFEKQQERLSKMNRISMRAFSAGGSTRPPRHEPGLNTGTLFVEAHKSTVGGRPTDDTKRVDSKPFYVSLARTATFD